MTETPLMRKIRLLMAKAAGTSNEHEAAAFAAKVQEMLLENGLSAADIRAAAPGSKSEAVAEHAQDRARDFLKSSARKALLFAVCRFYMCSYFRWGNSRLTIVGKRANAEVAASMMEYLLTTSLRLSNEYARDKGNAARIDYRRGCMLRLAERLDALRMERERAARAPSSTGNTLPALFVSESALVQEYMRVQNHRKARPLIVRQGLHAVQGRKAADGVNLSPQVRAESNSRRLR